MTQTPKQTILIETEAHAKAVLDRMYKRNLPVAYDSEFVPETLELVLFQLCMDPRVRYVIRGEFFYVFREWLSGEDTRRIPQVVYQMAAADFSAMYDLGVTPEKTFHADTMILGWLVDENQLEYGLKEQAYRHLGWYRRGYRDLFSYDIGKRKPIILNPRQIMDGPIPEEAIANFVANREVIGKPCTPEEVPGLWREIMIQYAADDADSTIQLYWVHRAELEKYGYWSDPMGYEQDRLYTLTLLDVKKRGIKIDKHYTKEIQIKVERDQIRWLQVFRAQVGDPDINPRSTKQLAALISKLGWPIRPDLISAKTGEPSAGKEAIKWWIEEHGITEARSLFEYRKAAFMNTSFLASMLENCDEDGRIRTEMKQTSLTGRIRSSKITRLEYEENEDGSFETKKISTGMQSQNVPAARNDRWGVRGGFVAPKKGDRTGRGDIAQEDYKIIAGDYGGFELYMAIYNASRFTPQSEMLKYANKGANLHALSTYRMGLIPKKYMAEATALLRAEDWKAFKNFVQEGLDDKGKLYNIGKVGNLSLLYGGGAAMFCRLIGRNHLDPEQVAYAQDLIYAWQDAWPEIPTYQKQMVNFGYKYGYVPTVSGRRIHVKDGLNYKDKNEEKQRMIRSHWKRKSLNSPCQGCLPYDTRILTSGGYQRIGEAPEYGVVWTGTSWANYRRLNRGSWELAELHLSNGQRLVCDTRHQVLCKVDGQEVFKHYDDLQQNDQICMSQPDLKPYGTEIAGAEDHLYWLGMVVGCGTTQGNKVILNLTDYPSKKEIKLEALQKYLMDQGFFSDTFKHYLIDNDHTSQIHVTIDSEDWLALLRSMGYYAGHADRRMQIPDTVWCLSGSLRLKFIEGLIASLPLCYVKHTQKVFLLHNEYSFLKELQILARTCGVDAVIRESNGSHEYSISFKFTPTTQELTSTEYAVVSLVAKQNLDISAETFTLSVDSPLHRFDSEGIISKNSAADIVKAAMNAIEADEELRSLGYSQLLQIHDEILGECPVSTAEQAKERLFWLMKQPYKDKLKVNLVVEGRIADNWLEAK